MKTSARLSLPFLTALIMLAGALPADATHSWGGYHWARTSNPFTLKLVDSVTSAWISYLGTTSSDWSLSSVLDTTIVAGDEGVGTRKKCAAPSGQVRVCNSTYGPNGWLGLAGIYVSGSHITKGYAKLNDTYFNTTKYNTPAWRNLVMCQEVGHTFGLNHQDEIFDNPNLGTCMDYTNDPSSNQHPNAHDYEQLEAIIYAHLDSTTTVAASLPSASNGRGSDEDDERIPDEVRARRDLVFAEDLPGGVTKITFIYWIE